jgi:hypothetical protein
MQRPSRACSRRWARVLSGHSRLGSFFTLRAPVAPRMFESRASQRGCGRTEPAHRRPPRSGAESCAIAIGALPPRTRAERPAERRHGTADQRSDSSFGAGPFASFDRYTPRPVRTPMGSICGGSCAKRDHAWPDRNATDRFSCGSAAHVRLADLEVASSPHPRTFPSRHDPTGTTAHSWAARIVSKTSSRAAHPIRRSHDATTIENVPPANPRPRPHP